MWDVTAYSHSFDSVSHVEKQGTIREGVSSGTETTLTEMIAESRERTKENRDRFRCKPSINYGDVTLEAYARLARARTAADVSAAAGYARRRIVQFKSALRQDGDNADRIRAAIGQLQKAVLRAGKKKNDLNREKLAERQRERAHAERRRREELRTQAELQRRRTMRSIRERGYLQEAAISDQMASQLALAREEYKLQAPAVSPAPAPAIPASAGIPVGAVAETAAPDLSGFTAQA